MMTLLACAGVLADRVFGEPGRWHPLVGFGRLAGWLEQRLNRPATPAGKIARGLLAWGLLILPPVIGTALLTIWLAAQAWWLAAVWQVLLLYLALGARSLAQHVAPIAVALRDGDLPAARQLTARIVSRDTADADAAALAKAAVESTLENGNDAVFGALFWFLVGGAPAVVLFRLANTLDAMWGYRTPRFLHFGRVAARLDDALNWLPARLTAFSYALLGNTRRALACWRTQAPQWSSPNAGPVMASGAGSLDVKLGGPARYHGMDEQRPPLGPQDVAAPDADDITRALALVRHALWLWLAVCVALSLIMQGMAR
ncbi:cobalamin biosynthesis protein [Imbroritus primus]|uniref:Cobalamin biosynthesis protein n=1 Tax=Imbroritus primus TaxID=3058603 RepID=A0ACD3SL42_9BURK|nr:cobalamin biosynthesis protein [Burkholderiaceae bacterium PBA]